MESHPLNRLGLYTASQYNNLKASIGEHTYTQHSLTPRVQELANTILLSRNRQLMLMIEGVLSNDKTDGDRIKMLRQVYAALENPNMPVENYQ